MNAFEIIITVFGALAALMALAGLFLKPSTVYSSKKELQNPMEGKRVVFVENKAERANADGVCGHLEAVGACERLRGFYPTVLKRLFDILMSFLGLIVLLPVFLIICAAIVIDDPGPVFFAQKRVGKNKRYFKLHKFRSMKMSTPHDVPTHMLGDPEKYITRVGRFLRKSSLDELPQIFDIFIGNMSVIGPRPALFNQDLLTAERDKWGANEMRPGLTGWAQINGRDELEIPEKAKLDGEYAAKLRQGGFKAFAFDFRCFLGTVFSVARGDGVVEGGTGKIKSKGKK